MTANPGSRAASYGDGLFETLYVNGGHAECLALHLERLALGAMRLAIKLDSLAAVKRQVRRYCRSEFGSQSGVLKILLMRTQNARGYGFSDAADSEVWIAGWPGESLRVRSPLAIDVGLSPLRLARQTHLAGMKHLNRLEQVLSAGMAPYDEVIQLDSKGYVVCASSGNVFAIKGDTLMTPGLAHSGVCGITRQLLLADANNLGFATEVGILRVADLRDADELFITNSRYLVRPVSTFADTRYAKTTHARRLHTRLQELVAEQ